MQVTWPLCPRLPERTSPPQVCPDSKRGTAPSPEGELGLWLLRWPCWTTGVALGILAAPSNEMLISIKDPWVVLDSHGRKENWLLNWYRATLLCLNFSHWTSLLQKLYCDSCWWKASNYYFTGHFPCQFKQRWILHAFLVVPQCPTPVLRRDLLSSPGAILRLGGPKQAFILTLRQTNLFPETRSYSQPYPIGSKLLMRQRNPCKGSKGPTCKNEP